MRDYTRRSNNLSHENGIYHRARTKFCLLARSFAATSKGDFSVFILCWRNALAERRRNNKGLLDFSLYAGTRGASRINIYIAKTLRARNGQRLADVEQIYKPVFIKYFIKYTHRRATEERRWIGGLVRQRERGTRRIKMISRRQRRGRGG